MPIYLGSNKVKLTRKEFDTTIENQIITRTISSYEGNASIVRPYAFAECKLLVQASFPACTSIGTNAFAYCSSLTEVSFPLCTSIGTSAFQNCYNLISLNLTSVSSVPTLGITVFYSTPIGGYSASAGKYGSVYVPASLYNSFLTAANWSSIASRIVSA